MSEQKPFEWIRKIRPGDVVLRWRRPQRVRLRVIPSVPGIIRFLRVVIGQTPLVQMTSLFVVLWLLFSAGIYFADRGASGTTIHSYGDAVYVAVAGFSTAGIADMPVTAVGKALSGIWMALGAMLYFGTIIAVITTYFMRPLQRPTKQIISTIQYNLEQLESLSLEELQVLKETTDGLIDGQIERLKGES